MTMERLTAALADRYRIERELGQGGVATELAAESRGSAGVAEATGDPAIARRAARRDGVAWGTELAAESLGSATSER